MKNHLRLTLALMMIGFLSIPAFAGGTESARVIRIIKDTNDLIVERLNGELWLIEHNAHCTSMSTEFPVSLLVSNNKITKLKVSWNEICDVYYSMPFGGEAKLLKIKTSENQLKTNHEAEIEWKGATYSIDYGEGCKYLYSWVDKNVFVQLLNGQLVGGQMAMPSAGGQCTINTAQKTGDAPADPNAPAALSGLDYEAQNNQVYFYWDKAPEGKVLYLISYSRNKLNPADYPWKQMPNIKYTNTNSYTLANLANGRLYYIYLAVLNADGVVGPWKEVTATPVSPGGIKNNADLETFEVKMEEKADSFRLYWPAKDKARKFRVSLYVSGKFELSKTVSADTLEYSIPKKPEYLGKGLRFTVRSLPKRSIDPTYFDGIYWAYKAKK